MSCCAATSSGVYDAEHPQRRSRGIHRRATEGFSSAPTESGEVIRAARAELNTAMNNNLASIPPAQWKAKYGYLKYAGSIATVAISTFLSKSNEDSANSTRSHRGSGPLQRNGSEPQSPFPVMNGRAIKTLDLSSLSISDSDFAKLVPVLMEDSVIQNVYLQDNFISDAGVEALIEQVKDERESNSSIQFVSLSQNDITLMGIVSLLLYSSRMPSLRQLIVGGKAKGDAYGADFRETVAKMGKELTKSFITRFTFEGEGDCSAAVEAVLCEVLLSCSSLTKFSGSRFSLPPPPDANASVEEPLHSATPSGLITPPPKSLMTVLRDTLASSSRRLTSLVLHVPLNVEAATLLSEGIKQSKVLEKLVLSDCNLDGNCFRVIGEVLANNRTLRFLNLSRPHPTMRTAPEPVLRPSLTTVSSPSENPLFPLIDNVCSHSRVKELVLRDVYITIFDLEYVCETIETRRNRSLIRLETSFMASNALLLKLDGLLQHNQASSSSNR